MTRDEAINLLDNMLGMVQDNHGSDYDKAIHTAIDALEQLPPAEPERLTDDLKLSESIYQPTKNGSAISADGKKPKNINV